MTDITAAIALLCLQFEAPVVGSAKAAQEDCQRYYAKCVKELADAPRPPKEWHRITKADRLLLECTVVRP